MEARVVVIGGGPSGLAAATEIARLGAGLVVLLERDAVVGGIPRYCSHSPFGMREFRRILSGPAYAARLEREAAAAGVRILTRHSVLSAQEGTVTAATPEGIVAIRAERIVLATGAREMPRSARLVSGDRPIGVINTGALQFYVHQQHLAPFRRPVIVGTELVSMSAILSCLSGGIRPVAVLEELDHSTARFPFRLLPHVLRIPVLHKTKLVDIRGGARVEEVVVSVDGQQRTLACDGVLLTGRFVPEAGLARMSGLQIDRSSGGPAIDGHGRTSDPHVFATGNLLRPIETAGWCWSEGRRIARNVVDDLKGRLPAPEDRVAIHAGNGVKLVVPQVVSHVSAIHALGDLQVRLLARVRGRLSVSDGEKVVWSRPLASGPERRILIPVREIDLSPAVRTLTVSVSSSAGE